MAFQEAKQYDIVFHGGRGAAAQELVNFRGIRSEFRDSVKDDKNKTRIVNSALLKFINNISAVFMLKTWENLIKLIVLLIVEKI